MIKAVFFDLFFTLIDPICFDENNEYDVINITPEEWETYAEDMYQVLTLLPTTNHH